MIEFVKKGFTGYKQVTNDDASCTHVILSKEEYEDLKDKIREQEEKITANQKNIKSSNEEIMRYSHALQREINETKEEKEKTKRVLNTLHNLKTENQELEDNLNKTQEKLDKEINLNENLKRIARERANQKRGIQPKKAHDGYIVLTSQEWTERFKKDNEWKSVKVWKSLVQTPFTTDLDLEQVAELILKNLWKDCILDDLGCSRRIVDSQNGSYMVFTDNNTGKEVNGLYKWNYRANYRAGLWEVELYTTKSLQVPAYRRPNN